MKLKNLVLIVGAFTAILPSTVFAEGDGITDGCNPGKFPAQSKPWNPRNPIYQPCFPLPINDGVIDTDYDRGYSAGYVAGKRDLDHSNYNSEKQIPVTQDRWSIGFAMGYAQAGQERPQDMSGLG